MASGQGRGSGAAPPSFNPVHFKNVTVYPTQELLKPPFVLFRGGPDWPLFWLQRDARHCRYDPPVPLDLRPHRTWKVNLQEGAGTWCGPVSQHFGHAIASFGSRIPLARQFRADAPLVFSARAGEQPPAFFWQLLAHFGVEPREVRIVSEPTRFASLSVTAHAERMHGRAPREEYLDLLDQLGGSRPKRDGSKLYVSRAGLWKGKIAGESYIEDTLGRLGYATFRPETVDLSEQLAAYRRASHLIFAEGSALHALQLLGRLPAQVLVVVRRNKSRIAETALRARVASLHYIDAAQGMLRGLSRSGWPQPSAGMTILDDDLFVASLERLGIPIRQLWHRPSFLQRQAQDLAIWTDARLEHPTHRRDGDVIRRSLRDLRIALNP